MARKQEERKETPGQQIDPHEYLQAEAHRWKNDEFTRIITNEISEQFLSPVSLPLDKITGESALVSHGIALGVWAVLKALRNPAQLFEIAEELKETFTDEQGEK